MLSLITLPFMKKLTCQRNCGNEDESREMKKLPGASQPENGAKIKQSLSNFEPFAVSTKMATFYYCHVRCLNFMSK